MNTLLRACKAVARLPYERRNRLLFNEILDRDFGEEFPFSANVFHSQGIRSGHHYQAVNYRIWARIQEILYRSRPRPDSLPRDLSIITCTNLRDEGTLERSLRFHGWDFARYFRWGADCTPWQNGEKIRLLQENLDAVKTEFVLFCDSHDTVIGSFRGLLDKFAARDCQMLFNAERTVCYPKNFNRSVEEAIAARECGTLPTYPYLNSGVWLARSRFARELIARAADLSPRTVMPWEDQLVFKSLFPGEYPAVRLDYRADIFQTLQFLELSDLAMTVPVRATQAHERVSHSTKRSHDRH